MGPSLMPIQNPKTDAGLVLDHMQGNEFDLVGRTLSEIAASSGGTRKFTLVGGEATMIWTFNDASSIHTDMETWTPKERKHG